MPSLSELTDYDPMGNVTGVAPEADGIRRVYIGSPGVEDRPASKGIVESITNKLLGLNGEERYQLWPEKVVREGLSAAGDAYSQGLLPPGLRREDFTDIPAPDTPTKDSTVLGKFMNIAPVAASPADNVIEKAQAMSALAGSGGLTGSSEGTVLNATPSLRPALKYKDRLYKGKEGQSHQDVIPDALYPEFQKMAMSGEDISHYNFGFVNDKGQFLNREAALEYGVNTGLIDPAAGKYGALTSTLLADSSKPGTAIEAMAKTAPDWNIAKNIDANLKGDVARAIDTWVGGPHNALETGYGGGAWHPDKLKNILKNPELKAQLDESIKPFKDDLRAKYGDTIPLYRYHGKLPEGAKSDRELLSFSTDPEVPKNMAGVKKEASLFSDKDIAAKEKEFADKGEVKIGHYTLTKNEFGSLDINDPRVGGFLTDTDSVAAWMKDLNSEAKQFNASNADKSKMIYKQDVPIDDIVYATDRFGQKEFIVRNKNLNLFADSSKPGMAIEATAKANAPQFYSALEHNVNQISQGKMTGDQWLGTLANKPGVKPEELQWSGLKDFLEQNKGKPVNKESIQQHLNENKTELGEVVRGGKTKEQIDARARELGEDDNGGRWDTLGGGGQEHYYRDARKENATKYSQYQVPGGENYREVLMTLPPTKNILEQHKVIRPDGHVDSTYANAEGAASRAQAIGGTVKQEQNVTYNGGYKSSHWDEPNILAHMRMNDRTIDGKKSLHLEEVQSDWHQDGRKKGYKEPIPADLQKNIDNIVAEKLQPNAKYLPAQVVHTKGKVDILSASDSNIGFWENQGVLTKDEANAIRKYKSLADNQNAVPDAPFKKNWHELALKRAIREAASEGYERLSWTAGEHHPTNPKNLNQRGPEADAADRGMQGFYNNMLPKSVEKLTGQKVKEGSVPNGSKELSVYKGPDHSLDQIKEYNTTHSKFWNASYIKQLNKIQKEMENGKSFKEAIVAEGSPGLAEMLGGKLDSSPKTAKVYYIDLPQSVKDTALGKGFPLYSSTHMFTPVVGNPFEKNDK